jgi:hypothetical protein
VAKSDSGSLAAIFSQSITLLRESPNWTSSGGCKAAFLFVTITKKRLNNFPDEGEPRYTQR